MDKLLAAINIGAVNVPQKGRDHVYKTEGVFTFENPEFPRGLYVSLNTFQSYSYEYACRIVRKHPQSCVFLNIRTRKTKKEEAAPTPSAEKQQQQQQQQPTTLGIGVEGGFKLEEDIYDIHTTYTIVIMNNDDNDDGETILEYPNAAGLPELVTKSVEAILALEDAGKMREVQAWVEERSVSKFAKDLVQLDNGVKISPNPADWKCAESGMSENLWLNLSTGHIGSGRQNWDGTGGTGAALRHFEETGSKYPLVVKLGTITAKGADVYSYDPSENDMVEDPYLAQHLAHWGINMMLMEKTEKTMAELSIDLNLKYEFDAIQEAGVELEALHGPGYMGLRNLGNSCYMSSLLQVLFSLRQVQHRYVDRANEIFDRAPLNAADSLEVQMAKLGVALCTDRYCNNEGIPEDFLISPQMLRVVLGRQHPEFSSNRQQDAFEYYQHVMEMIARDDRRLRAVVPEHSSVPLLFTYSTEERLECMQSHQVRYSVCKGNNALSLELPLDAVVNSEEIDAYYSKTDDAKRMKLCDAQAPPGIIEFQHCIEHFLRPRVSDGFMSPATGQRGQAGTSTRLVDFPPYLMVQLRRYVVGADWTPKKLNVVVNMPQEYDFGALRSAGGLQDGEVELKDAAAAAAAAPVEADEMLVAQLLSFGMFSENGCKRAVLATNNSNADAAMNWGLEHMNDADFNDPPAAAAAAAAGGTPAVDAESLMMLESMGFPRDKATKALVATDGNLERATDWLFSRVDDDDDDDGDGGGGGGDGAKQQQEAGNNNNNSKYELVAIISHMGPSVHVGHYVCHIKKDNQWAIFNDRKVARSEKTPFGLGFLYIYRRIDN